MFAVIVKDAASMTSDAKPACSVRRLPNAPFPRRECWVAKSGNCSGGASRDGRVGGGTVRLGGMYREG
jgi:hypothetical protein